jgi:SAM-dependent methyltransferase
VSSEGARLAVREFHDRLAEGYDASFGQADRGNAVRREIQSVLLGRFKHGDRILELGCGTGTDAVVLARHGIHVTATDISPRMVEMAAAKCRKEGLASSVCTSVLDAGDLRGLGDRTFDGAFLNFNVLNYLEDVRGFANQIGPHLRPGAPLICTLLNRVALWEVAYFAARLRPVLAYRRVTRRGLELSSGQGNVPLRLYFPRTFARSFDRDFSLERITGLGILQPPAGFAPPSVRWAGVFRRAASIDAALAGRYPFYNICDHYVVELRKRGEP